MNQDTPPLGRRQRNKTEKRKRIARAARDLFHEQGFDRTTTAQIARRAGVAEGTVFLYVTRKEDLLILAFTDEMAEVVNAAASTLSQATGFVAQMLSFFSALLTYHVADPLLARAFLREVGFLREPMRDFGFGDIAMFPSIEAIVDRAKAAGEVGTEFSSSDIATLAFSAYWYCLRDWANQDLGEQAFTDRLRILLTMQIKGIEAP